MMRSRFSEEQIIAILKEQESGGRPSVLGPAVFLKLKLQQ